MIQKQKFLESEGDRWFERNTKTGFGNESDPVLVALAQVWAREG